MLAYHPPANLSSTPHQQCDLTTDFLEWTTCNMRIRSTFYACPLCLKLEESISLPRYIRCSAILDSIYAFGPNAPVSDYQSEGRQDWNMSPLPMTFKDQKAFTKICTTHLHSIRPTTQLPASQWISPDDHGAWVWQACHRDTNRWNLEDWKAWNLVFREMFETDDVTRIHPVAR